MSAIFLVEDNQADVELFRMALQKAGVDCTLIVFEDGPEFVNHIRRADSSDPTSSPDLLVLDLNLPKTDGIDLLELIRQTPFCATIPIAVLSSSSWARERAQLAVFQICKFITKPPDLEEYLTIGTVIRDLLEETKSQPGAAKFTAAG